MSFCTTDIKVFDLKKLNEYITSFKDKNIVLILTDEGIERWKLTDSIKALRERNDVTYWGEDIKNPTQVDIAKILNMINSEQIDLILVIGGGSLIDLAKSVSAVFAFKGGKNITPEEISDIIVNKKYLNNNSYIDIIAIPTTAGTGSEVTQWATVWDYQGIKKYSIDSKGLKPVTAIIVPELTYTLPKRVVLSTVLDALSHAVEAFWSVKTNAVIQEVALRAVTLIANNLKNVLLGTNKEYHMKKLCMASLLAGLAFSQTRTTACHAISYPLTMHYHIPHGIAAIISLPYVLEINKTAVKELAEVEEIFHPYGGLQNWLTDVSEGLVKLNLSAYGIGISEIEKIIDECFTPERMNNNPVELNRDDIRNILTNVL